MVLRVPITSCHLASIGRESPDVQWKLGSGRPLEGFRGDVAVADHSSVCSHKRRCCVLRRALGISLRRCYLCRDSALVAEPTGSRLPLDSFFFGIRTVWAKAVLDPGCQGQLPRVMELIIQRCLEPQIRPCRTYRGIWYHHSALGRRISTNTPRSWSFLQVCGHRNICLIWPLVLQDVRGQLV